MEDSSKSRMGSLVLFAAVVGLAIAQFSAMSTLRSLQSKLADVESEQAKAQANAKDVAEGQLAQIREALAADGQERQKALESIRGQMEQANRLARGAAGKAKEEALKGVQDLTARVNSTEQKLRETHAEVSSDLNNVKQAATSAQSNVAAVATEVKDVRSEIASTRGQLDRAAADLRQVTGDLGILSGRIATNSREIGTLKALGDRNYIEFTLAKNKDPVRVGDVGVILKKSDTGRSRFTVELYYDDRKIEKKDRAVNEPVQFYVGRNKQPHELVINQVKKDQIVGYLASPKALSAR